MNVTLNRIKIIFLKDFITFCFINKFAYNIYN